MKWAIDGQEDTMTVYIVNLFALHVFLILIDMVGTAAINLFYAIHGLLLRMHGLSSIN